MCPNSHLPGDSVGEHPLDENRRPLKSREWTIFRRVAAVLARTGVTPNAISLSSILFAIAAGGAFFLTGGTDDVLFQRVFWIAGAAFIQLRLVANLLDGMVAIEGGKKSVLGALYNEVPDRISDTAIFIGAGFALGGNVFLGLLAALVSIFVAYIRAMGASAGVGQVFLGPMAKPQRMAAMTVCALYCGIAPLDWQPYWQNEYGVTAAALLLIVIGGLFTACRRLLAIARRLHAGAEGES